MVLQKLHKAGSGQEVAETFTVNLQNTVLDPQRFRVSGKGVGIFWTVLKRSDEFQPWQASSTLLSSPTSNTK